MTPDARKRVTAAISALALYAGCGSSTVPEAQHTAFADTPKHHAPTAQDTPESFVVPERPKRKVSRSRVAPPVGHTTPRAAEDGDIWAALARCESGMRQDATSASGRYLSYFQWSLPTWRSVGGVGDPRDASYATQVELAQRLQARSGWGQWPRCSAKLGLR